MSRADNQTIVDRAISHGARIVGVIGGGKKELALPVESKKPNKYRNEHCEYNGMRFDSKHELKVYLMLVGLFGEKNVIRQVSIPIGELRIRPDFMVITERRDDKTFTARLFDAKGMITPEWRAKANDLKGRHGLTISLIRGNQGAWKETVKRRAGAV